MLKHLALATLVVAAPLAHAQEAEQQPTIAISARGTASAVPDLAELSFAVEERSNIAKAALDRASKVVDDALAALAELGVAERDVQTSRFSVDPVVVYPNRNISGASTEDVTPKVVGYRVTNGVAVRLRDLDRLGEVLDRMVTLGMNSIGSIRFTNVDVDPIREEARRDAVAKAVRRAKVLAGAAGVTLGRVLSIRENPVALPRQRQLAIARSSAAEAVPIARGEEEYSVTVQMEWAIEQ